MTTPTAISTEIQKLAPSAVIELYQLDAAAFGGDIIYFHAGTNGLLQRVTWQGQAYEPFPVQITGFEYSGAGQLPRPTLRVANVTGVITALVLAYGDMLGAKVTRKRTMLKFLDEVNFPDGTNPTADATAEFDDDVYFIDRKASENRDVVEFELAAAIDLQGVMLPRRQIVQNVCPWKYRGAECGYTGTVYLNANDVSVATLAQDVCGKRLTSCKLRFGQFAELPYGGFPAAGLVR